MLYDNVIRTRAFLLTASLLLAASQAQAIGWYDDWNDGDALDGMPVTWIENASGLQPGIYDASTGDYRLSAPEGPLGNDDSLTASVDTIFTDTYVRTQAVIEESPDLEIGGNVAVVARFDPINITGYGAFMDHGALLTFIRVDGVDLENCGGVCVEPLDVFDFPGLEATEDIIIELDAVGSQLEVFMWRPGEEKPAVPQSSIVDATYASGQAGISYNEDSNATVGVFRWAQALDQPIPNKGDTNGDGEVNFGDLTPFTLALTDPAAYSAQFPGFATPTCDINMDGACNFGDLSPFVALLTGDPEGSGSSSVPEPSTLLLLAGVVLAGTLCRRATR